MKRFWRALPPAITLVCLLSQLCWYASPSRAGLGDGPGPPTKRALLVGIADYPPAGPDERDLPGVSMDIKKMKKLLVKDYGFDEKNVVCVQDGDATKERIERELIALASEAGESDAVVFYYSGHGALLPDVSGDEDSGWDQALVPAAPPLSVADSESDLDKFLLDDRVHELLSNFKTKNLTIIFDSCFSGEADRRGQGPPVSGVSFTKRLEITPSPNLILKAEHVKRDHAHESGNQFGRGYTFLAASQGWETSECGSQGSFFTTALVSELEADRGASWNQLFRRVQGGVLNENPTQTPRLVSGGGGYLPFTLTELHDEGAHYTRPSLGVEQVLGNESAILGAYESVYEEYVGALYDIYPALDASFARAPVGRVRIEEGSDEDRAVGKILRGTVEEGSRAVPVSVPLLSARPRVMLSVMPGSDAEQNRQLGATLEALYNLLGRRTDVRAYSPSHPAPGKVDYHVLLLRSEGRYVARLSAGGGPTSDITANDVNSLASDAAREVVKRHNEFIRLVRLHNPSPPFRLDVNGQDTEYAPGERGYRITLTAQRPCWINVISTTMSGGPKLAAASRRRLGLGEPFSFTVPRPEKDKIVLKVFATEAPLDLRLFERIPPSQRVETLYRKMLDIATTGGGGPTFISTSKWADETVWVEAPRQ